MSQCNEQTLSDNKNQFSGLFAPFVYICQATLLTFLYDVTVIPKVVQKRVHFLPCPPRHQAPQRAYS